MREFAVELAGQEEKLLNCVHCGFCLPACPTYARLGDEADSPRGRLHFMRAAVEGRLPSDSPAFHRHLDRCLGCRACESVCPSGVEYGRLLESVRGLLTRSRPRPLLERILASVMARRWMRAPALALTRMLRGTGLAGALVRHLPEGGALGPLRLALGMVAATRPPRILGHRPAGGMGRGGVPPGSSSSLGRGMRTGSLRGCVQEGLLGRVNRATLRVLAVNGFEPVEVRGEVCCGAIHAHGGDREGALALARANIRAFEEAGVEVVAVNAAGCGAAMKEYGYLLEGDPAWASRASVFSERVKDVCELLGREGLRKGGRVAARIAYDAPCHLLHAQGVADEVDFLLDSIPGLERVPLLRHDECCGGAGVYGITHPDLGGAIGRDKVRQVLATGAELVVTGNPGCMMQIGAGLQAVGAQVEVVHPVELLDLSYRAGGFYSD